MLINRYSLPRASIGITAPYGGTYLCNIDQQAINFLLLIFNYQTMPQAFQARKFFIPKTDPSQGSVQLVPIIYQYLLHTRCGRRIAEVFIYEG